MSKRAALFLIVFFFTAGCLKADDSSGPGSIVMPIDPAGVESLIASEGSCPAIISIISSRCGACRQEMPIYQKIYDKYRERGLAFFVISIDFGSSEETQALVDRMGLTTPVYWGGEPVMWAYDVSLVPLKIIVRNGEIVESLIGLNTEAEMKQIIGPLIDECAR
ncbi:MAG: TlpA disulfide reductase family protein [Syntrophales bacterium]|nr:TlpA disulfide reductase family protein [Syntrophales bacterium]